MNSTAYTSEEFKNLTQTLRRGGIAVVRTDTVYGIIAVAANEKAVEKVFLAKHRAPEKQCIVLVSSADDVGDYAPVVKKYSQEASTPTSVVVPATNEPSWLLRGGTTIAYRVARDPLLNEVIKAVGPVIAPSANPEGLPTARTIKKAREYFGDSVDYYSDGGRVPESTQPSDIVTVSKEGDITMIRGASPSPTPQLTGSLPLRHSSGGLVFHDGKVLLIHWAPPRSTYDFPKGTIELNETSEEACVREVFEETGYRTRIIEYIGTNEFDFQTPSGEWRHKINDYYLLELVDETPEEARREPHETFENVWVPIEEAEQVITRDINKDIFAKALTLVQR